MSSQPQYKYTVATPHGDVKFTTPYHHSEFKDPEDFLKRHDKTIALALGLTGIVASTLVGLWVGHGRGGQKLK